MAASEQILMAADNAAGRYEMRQSSMMRPGLFQQHRVRETEVLRSSALVHITHSFLQITDER